MQHSTIAAIATAPGAGGIAIVRLSGPESYEVCGIFGDCKAFDPMLILIVPMAVIAVLANLTAFARIAHCYKLLKKQ